MKAILASDFHLKTTDSLGKTILPIGLNSRLIDRINAIKTIVDDAIEKEVEFVAIAGDLFDRLNPIEVLKKILIEALAPLMLHKIKTYLLIGNHDTDLAIHNLMGEKELVRSVLGANDSIFKVVNEPVILDFKFNGKPVLLLPWIGEKEMVKCLKSLSKPHIVITHISAIGAKIQDYQIKVGEVDPDDFKQHLVFSGHIHKHQVIRENWIHIGSSVRMDFSEAQDPKGYIEINESGWKFIEIPDKTLATLEVTEEYNQYGFLDLIPDLKDKHILRVIFSGTENWYAGLDKKRIKTVLQDRGAHKIFTQFNNTTLKGLKNSEIVVDTKFNESIKIYCRQENREDMVDLGLEILRDVESLPL